MMEQIPRKPQKHLINILKTTSNHHPNFTLFLGAGASVTSGVLPAGKLIEKWREEYIDMHGVEDLEQRHWYGENSEYSELFETLYDQPSQRREFIESCIEDASPSWGYIYLVNLLKEQCFNTVFTTNFDDLLNEACYMFSKDLRPIVSAHDSSIKSVRLTSIRPKIVKLHGDFLFDDIKNTVRELESLENNMRSKFKQYASEFGMIVVGYAGNDRSIMDTLNTLLHNDSNFPHGIYWCVRKDSPLSPGVINLTRFDRFHIVEIEGFDEFFADINHSLNLKLQDEVANPYDALAKRLDNFVSNFNEDGEHNPIIQDDINQLSDHIQHIHSALDLINRIKDTLSSVEDGASREQLLDVVKQLTSDTHIVKNEYDDLLAISTPKALLAAATFREDAFDEALTFSLEALKSKIRIDTICIAIKSMSKLNNFGEFESVLSNFKSINKLTTNELSTLISTCVDLLSQGHFDESRRLIKMTLGKNFTHERSEIFLNLNLALSYRMEDKEIETATKNLLESYLKTSLEKNDNWLSFGLAIILEEEDVILKCAHSFDKVEFSNILNREMPIINLISEDLYAKLIELAKEAGFSSSHEDEADETDEENILPFADSSN